MKYLFLDTIPILQPLLDFDINGQNIDLHNDFNFVKVEINGNSIEFTFKRMEIGLGYAEMNAAIIFNNVLEYNYGDQLELNSLKEGSALMNFAKGDLTAPHKYSENKSLIYFFMELDSGLSMVDIFCKNAIIILW